MNERNPTNHAGNQPISDLAQRYQDMRSSRHDVHRTVAATSRSNSTNSSGSHDRYTYVRVVGSTEPAAEATATAATSTTGGQVTVYKNGVPHKVRFDWRGASVWMASVAAIAILVGLVK